MTKVLLVDQSDIPASFNCISLFLGDTHIVDADETNDIPIEDIAENLGKALDTPVVTLKLSERQLARAIARHEGLEEQFRDCKENNDFEEIIQGYTNEDVLRAVKEGGE